MGTRSLSRALGRVVLVLAIFGLGVLAVYQALEINRLHRHGRELAAALRASREAEQELKVAARRSVVRAERLERRWRKSRLPMSAEQKSSLRGLSRLLDHICRALEPTADGSAPETDRIAYARMAEVLGILHSNLQEVGRAEAFWSKALVANLELRGERHPASLRVLERLLRLYEGQGRHLEAYEVQQVFQAHRKEPVFRPDLTGPERE